MDGYRLIESQKIIHEIEVERPEEYYPLSRPLEESAKQSIHLYENELIKYQILKPLFSDPLY